MGLAGWCILTLVVLAPAAPFAQEEPQISAAPKVVGKVQQLKVEEHNLVDKLDAALLQNSQWRSELQHERLLLTEVQTAADAQEAAVLKSAEKVEEMLTQAQEQTRLLMRLARQTKVGFIVRAQAMGESLRAERFVTRWLHRLGQKVALAHAELDAAETRRATLATLRQRQRALFASVESEKKRLEADEAELRSLLQQVRNERADSEQKIFVQKELETPRISDEEVAEDPFFLRRGALPRPARGPVQAAFGRYQNGPFSAVLSRAGVVFAASGPVRTVFAGEVTFAGAVRGLKNVVVVEHTPAFASLYGGLDALAVTAGRHLQAEAVVGVASQTLHFEIRRGVQPEDPLPWLAP